VTDGVSLKERLN